VPSFRRYLLTAALAALIIAASIQWPACGQDKAGDDRVSQLITAMSQIQSYIEFYYMETGVYPKNLKDLEKIYNEEAVKEGDRVIIPKDPATGKDFVYEYNKEANTYRLSCPDPSQYGMKKCELVPIKWGWMNVIPEEKKRKAYASFCKYNLDHIGAALKKYMEQEKKLPKSLKEMVPAYMKALPGCPFTGKDYVFTAKGDEVIIACPNPKEHGFTVFEISSKSGFKALPIMTQEPSQKAPGSGPDVKKPGGPATPPVKQPDNTFK